MFVIILQPLETKLISETSGLFEANRVARVILNDALVMNQFLNCSIADLNEFICIYVYKALCVSVCVCVSAHNSGTGRAIVSKFSG